MDLNQRPHHANSKAVGMTVAARTHAVVFSPPIAAGDGVDRFVLERVVGREPGRVERLRGSGA